MDGFIELTPTNDASPAFTIEAMRESLPFIGEV